MAFVECQPVAGCPRTGADLLREQGVGSNRWRRMAMTQFNQWIPRRQFGFYECTQDSRKAGEFLLLFGSEIH